MSTDDRVEHRKASLQTRILVVDDEAVNRELISEVLVSEGYDVVTARCFRNQVLLVPPDL